MLKKSEILQVKDWGSKNIGICVDTLRARINYYNIGGENGGI